MLILNARDPYNTFFDSVFNLGDPKNLGPWANVYLAYDLRQLWLK